ncbi:carbon storage regulator [Pseudomonas syringae pv. pisi]|nr:MULTISPECIES: carbon storage regulator [Pseudomonas syringae group]POP68569.1 carbon storage regulator [Pseudomonas syringae]PYD08313.1 carbon storage regulator [Pseudomonas syringae pv. pisi]PYD24612.1 carbon storage regulator [Pseudomonas syringae pv. pisi]PYD24633.1 carbon storage regulator [Pseudomonas syringae pv. pisi]RMO28718.1 Carbon storage regulator-related protein [Pseudomonas syringae pv. pisi]
MLVLTRREGENILIEDGIQIQVLAISEFDQIVRIGIEAPNVAIVQCRDIDRKVTKHKPRPVIIHKCRWRSLVKK